jgi:hypothetical protein
MGSRKPPILLLVVCRVGKAGVGFVCGELRNPENIRHDREWESSGVALLAGLRRASFNAGSLTHE